ncbi:probable 2-oxoglutarate-dependent dioxygenase SLC1 [Aristolochia californica]|uniref:probable 2-oxoglutarate-dependent dioxygenase SLC1 n=1 Tax=Aristolochia californica TaxID=171875 RepID=UPI0035DD67C3
MVEWETIRSMMNTKSQLLMAFTPFMLSAVEERADPGSLNFATVGPLRVTRLTHLASQQPGGRELVMGIPQTQEGRFSKSWNCLPMVSASTVGIETDENRYKKGVRHLCDSGITSIPSKYVLPFADRPRERDGRTQGMKMKLPVIDFAEFYTCKRSIALESLAKACEEYGFFQVINHGISDDVVRSMIDASRCFFELPFDERAKYMSNDMSAPVRYGTSWNQNKDGVFCWRDFLKLNCPPLPEVFPQWPSSPREFRQNAIAYAKETRSLFVKLAGAILESLGLVEDETILKEFENGSQLMVLNCYPCCPEPDLTLGMPPHTDYGFLTVLLQDSVQGLQIQSKGAWVTVEPLPNSFVINVGDHLEVFSNGRYKSVLHRVLVNPAKSRISVASLHSLPYSSVISPSTALINEENPRRYKDTDFPTFLKYITAGKDRTKSFLDCIKLS